MGVIDRIDSGTLRCIDVLDEAGQGVCESGGELNGRCRGIKRIKNWDRFFVIHKEGSIWVMKLGNE